MEIENDNSGYDPVMSSDTASCSSSSSSSSVDLTTVDSSFTIISPIHVKSSPLTSLYDMNAAKSIAPIFIQTSAASSSSSLTKSVTVSSSSSTPSRSFSCFSPSMQPSSSSSLSNFSSYTNIINKFLTGFRTNNLTLIKESINNSLLTYSNNHKARNRNDFDRAYILTICKTRLNKDNYNEFEASFTQYDSKYK